MASRKRDVELPSFCSNCGQPVTAELAAKVANPTVVFCPACGRKLRADGTCGNRECENFETSVSLR